MPDSLASSGCLEDTIKQVKLRAALEETVAPPHVRHHVSTDQGASKAPNDQRTSSAGPTRRHKKKPHPDLSPDPWRAAGRSGRLTLTPSLFLSPEQNIFTPKREAALIPGGGSRTSL